jgi:hypothetical protein
VISLVKLGSLVEGVLVGFIEINPSQAVTNKLTRRVE